MRLSLIHISKEIADHAAKGGMLGISKESWMAALEKENYLKAAEMSMEDDLSLIHISARAKPAFILRMS